MLICLPYLNFILQYNYQVNCVKRKRYHNVYDKYSKILSVWVQVRTNVLSVLIWVQTVCSGYYKRKKSPLARKELRYFNVWIVYFNHCPPPILMYKADPWTFCKPLNKYFPNSEDLNNAAFHLGLHYFKR